MPIVTADLSLADALDIKVKVIYNEKILTTHIEPLISFEDFIVEIQNVCQISISQRLAIKWLDDTNDQRTLSSQVELEKAIRSYQIRRDPEIVLLVFPISSLMPGMLCISDKRSIYRKGAHRWQKMYRMNGHLFMAKRFNRQTNCSYCRERIWGLGRQGVKCIQCKMFVHKNCHKLISKPCTTREKIEPILNWLNGTSSNSENDFSSPEPDIHNFPEAFDEDSSTDSDTSQPPMKNYCLEDFEMIKVIGRGSYAKVLMVQLKKTDEIFALKIINKSQVVKGDDIECIHSEKRVFETVMDHPFFVKLHSAFQTPSRLFFVMDLIRGGDLMYLLQRQTCLTEEHSRFYAAEMCLALNFLHKNDIIFRDLKLDNILIDHEGHIKLADYGLCKEGMHPGRTTTTFCGTPNYIAPEIIRNEPYSFSVDWWSLGVVLYELLVGRSPFDVPSYLENPDRANEDYLFQVILETTIRFPRNLSARSNSILKGFLIKSPKERLGCQNIVEGFYDICSHPFFKTIDWEMLQRKQIPPPFKPQGDSKTDLSNFPEEFTNEPVQLTPTDDTFLSKINQAEFEGFDYVNPMLD